MSHHIVRRAHESERACGRMLALDSNEGLRIKRYIDCMNMLHVARKEFGFIAAAIERNQLAGDVGFIDEADGKMGILTGFRNRERPSVKINNIPCY